MPAAFVDHLWQSLLCLAAAWLCVGLARSRGAALRLWLWRLAAAKFLLPFSALYAAGAWLGFPVPHSADAPPAGLVTALHALTPLLAPAQSRGVTAAVAWLAVLALVPATVLALRQAARGMRLEHWLARGERLRLAADPDARPAGLGFVRAALFTLLALIMVSTPLLGGALDDRLRRRELLIEHSGALRDLRLDMKVAAPGMGDRMLVVADERGVRIRNANIQDLIAMVYGVNRYSVWNRQMYSEEAEPEDYWLIAPRYDLHVATRLRAPGDFDTYALRRPVTKLLAERFGLEIYLNDECQPPCGRYGVALQDDPL